MQRAELLGELTHQEVRAFVGFDQLLHVSDNRFERGALGARKGDRFGQSVFAPVAYQLCGYVVLHGNTDLSFDDNDLISHDTALSDFPFLHRCFAVPDHIRASTFRGFREYVQELGGEAEFYLRMGGVDPALLSDRDAYVPFISVVRTLEIAALALNMPDFGMQLGIRQEPGITGPLAIEPAAPGLEIVVHDTVMEQHAPHIQQTERVVAFLYNWMRRLCGDNRVEAEVWFMHRPLAPLQAYRDVFGVTPRFRQTKSGVVVPSAVLDMELGGRSTFVRSLAMAHMERVGSRDSKPVTDRVRAALDLMMHSGDANQVEVARALGLHERTLQRRLKGEGAAFEDIKDAVRRARAEEYLRQRELPLSQVAELLGYSEPAALSRSCRRWFGDTPKAVRRRLAA